MKTSILLFFFFPFTSCNVRTGSSTLGQDTTTYMLTPRLTAGSKYYYTFKRKSSFTVRVEGKKINSMNQSEAGANLQIVKDSSHNYLFDIRYDKIHLYTKSGDKETEIDADNAPNPFSFEQQILHALKGMEITATMDSTGKIISSGGYKEVEAIVMKNIPSDDFNTKIAIQKQLNQLVGDKLITGNINRLFYHFAGRGLHVGEAWKDTAVQEDDLDLKAISTYTLESVYDGIAFIKCKSNIRGENATIDMTGTKIKADIDGSKNGEYRMDIKTGIILKSDIKTQLDGTIYLLGKKIPLSFENTTTVKGDKTS